MSEQMIQVVMLELFDGRRLFYSGPVQLEDVDQENPPRVTRVAFMPPMPLPAGVEIGPIPKEG